MLNLAVSVIVPLLSYEILSVAVVGGVMGYLVIGEAVVIIALLLIVIQRRGKALNK